MSIITNKKIPLDTSSYKYGDLVEVKDFDNLTKAGYVIIGWSNVPNVEFNLKGKINTIQSIQNIYIKNYYTVTYYGLNNSIGTVPSDLNGYIIEDEIKVLGFQEIEKDGYEIVGWSTVPTISLL